MRLETHTSPFPSSERRGWSGVGFCLLALLALGGLGCKRPGTLNDGQIPQNPGQRAQEWQKPDPRIFQPREQPPPPPPGELPAEREYIAPEVTYLQQVLGNLSKAETFRADMNIPTDGGQAKAALAFKQSVGLYGSLENPGVPKTEVFIDSASVLFKNGAGEWSDLSNTADGNKLLNLFSTARISAPDSLLPYNAIFDRSEDAPDGCKRYDVRKSRVSQESMSICVKGDLPTYILVKSDVGELRIDYRDVNGSVEVYRPQVSS